MRASTWVWLVVGVLVAAELAVLWWVITRIGLLWTVVALVVIAALGAYLWRREGSRAWSSLADAQAHPDQVGSRLSDAALVFVGGLLLLLPGFLSDLVGLVFLLPVTRPLARRGLQAVLATAGRPWRDRVDLLDVRIRPDTVIRGETVDPPKAPGGGPTNGPDDPTIIAGEIEP